MSYNDDAVVNLYREWSRLYFQVAFEEPSPIMVRRFRDWIWQSGARPSWTPRADYERDMLAEYRRQEAEPC